MTSTQSHPFFTKKPADWALCILQSPPACSVHSLVSLVMAAAMTLRPRLKGSTKMICRSLFGDEGLGEGDGLPGRGAFGFGASARAPPGTAAAPATTRAGTGCLVCCCCWFVVCCFFLSF